MALFQGYKAWITPSAAGEATALWAEGGGEICDNWADAQYLFGDKSNDYNEIPNSDVSIIKTNYIRDCIASNQLLNCGKYLLADPTLPSFPLKRSLEIKSPDPTRTDNVHANPMDGADDTSLGDLLRDNEPPPTKATSSKPAPSKQAPKQNGTQASKKGKEPSKPTDKSKAIDKSKTAAKPADKPQPTEKPKATENLKPSGKPKSTTSNSATAALKNNKQSDKQQPAQPNQTKEVKRKEIQPKVGNASQKSFQKKNNIVVTRPTGRPGGLADRVAQMLEQAPLSPAPVVAANGDDSDTQSDSGEDDFLAQPFDEAPTKPSKAAQKRKVIPDEQKDDSRTSKKLRQDDTVNKDTTGGRRFTQLDDLVITINLLGIGEELRPQVLTRLAQMMNTTSDIISTRAHILKL